MNRIKYILLGVTLFVGSLLPTKSLAQAVEELSDSLVYGIAMYKELYNSYSTKKGLLQQDIVGIVKEEYPDIASKLTLNTKFEVVGIDLFSVLDLAQVISRKVGVPISEEQALGFTTVNDLFEAVRSRGDTIMLSMAYYPWRMVFDSRTVHRVSLYEDGIAILSDLIRLTTDSIQREIYLDELMNIYDVWCEYVDTINAKIDVPYSRTLIKSEKARKYVVDCMPIVYGVPRDSVTKANVMESFAVKAYDLLREALYEMENLDDLHYTIPLYYFPLTQSRIAYHHANKDTKTFEKQYHADFDSVEIRLSYLSALEGISEDVRKGNIRPNYDNIKESYNETCDMMDLGSATNWRELETVYQNLLAEKRELWDFGVEVPDADFLDRIIRSMRNDSSDVYIEALECYIEYIVPKSANIAEDKIDEYKKKRTSLVNAYIKRNRNDEAYVLLAELIGVEKNNIEKAHHYYRRGMIQLSKQNVQSAASNLKNAVKLNPNFGDAYYRLARAYAGCKFSNNESKDKLKYNLVVEVLQKAKKCIATYANSAEYGKYNTAELGKINSDIEAYKTHYIKIDEFHGNALTTKYNARIGERYVYDEGIMRGESAIIDVRYE